MQINNRVCGEPKCPVNNFITVDGSCEPCSPGSKVNPDKRGCSILKPICQGARQIYGPGELSCIECPDYLIANENNKECVEP